MTTGIDIWNYVGNWATSGSNWSQGAPPTSANEALISGGASTLNSAGVASTIILQPYAELFVTGGGTLQATNLTNNSGVLGVAENNGDGVDTVTLTGALNNAGQFTLGNSSLSASTTFSVAKLANSGTINLWGQREPRRRRSGDAENRLRRAERLDRHLADPRRLVGAIRLGRHHHHQQRR